MTPGDQASVTVTVHVPPAVAFRMFTEDINLWWRRGRRFRHAPGDAGVVCIETGPHGRVFESLQTDTGEMIFEVGRTRVWEPPDRLVFEWRNAAFAPHERTEVEIQFRAVRSGTEVTVTHRGWSAIRPDHPARHGLIGADFSRLLGMWWADLLTAFRLHSAGPPHRSGS